MDQHICRHLAFVACLSTPQLAAGAIPLYQNGSETKLELEIRVQLQYFQLDGENASENDLFFRRLRPTFEARWSEDWEAEVELDFGETIEGEAVEFKDLFAAYSGLDTKGLEIVFGHAKAAFSRQYQSSSKRLTLVERGFVGIDDFGTLDRVVGARLNARDAPGHKRAEVSFGLAAHEPDAFQLEFESPLNAAEDANQGFALSGRFEISPLGEVLDDQETFVDGPIRFALGAAAYRWSGHGSRKPASNPTTVQLDRVDLDHAHGLELCGVLQGRAFTANTEVHWIRGRAVDPAYTLGLYRDGDARLSKLSVQSGYFVIPDRVEIVGGFDRLDAETYPAAWKRISVGGTHYWKRHDLKLQMNYLRHWSMFGVMGDDPQSVLLQLQLLF